MTQKQTRFALGKVGGLSTREAALNAGYSKSTVDKKGFELERNVGIKREIVSIFDRIGLTDKKLARIHKEGLTKASILKDGQELPDYRVRLGYLRLAHELRGNIQEVAIQQTVVNVTPEQAREKIINRLEAIKQAEKEKVLTHKELEKST